MKPLAKLWTWIGQIFVPLAIGWAIYIRNGFGEKFPPDGVLISRGYWGVLITLLAGSALVWTLALYVDRARKSRARILVPPNTAFEESKDRSLVISYGTVLVFALSLLVALVMFGERYSESAIYAWDAKTPIEHGFWQSRKVAHGAGCSAPPCFAVGQRMDDNGNPLLGVNEYVLYLTDGVLALLAVLLIAGVVFLIVVSIRRPSRRRNVMAGPTFMPQWQYETLSQKEGRILGVSADDLVSIKLRPIESVGVWHDRYVYGEEYRQIGELLSSFPLVSSEENKAVYQLPDGNRFIYATHENGPEIIFVADIIQHYAIATGASALALRQLLKLVNDIYGILNKEAQKQREGKPSDRHHQAGAVSIESRTTRSAKILKQIGVAAEQTGKAISKITDLL
jgi:hypothetical protein